MNFLKNNKTELIVAFCFVLVLTAAFFYGGRFAEEQDTPLTVEQGKMIEDSEVNAENLVTEAEEPPVKAAQQQNKKVEANIEKKQQKSQENETNSELRCTLSVRCDNAVGKISDKSVVIPTDGIIFAEQMVAFTEGESVFDLLLREMRKNKIHFEFVNTPIYNSAYIEGIANLYEFDCGELSGWMYRVNGQFPQYGCSQYILKPGDKVELVYTCDLGKDVGGEYSARNGN